MLEFQRPVEGKPRIFFNIMDYSFGLMHRTIDQIIIFNDQIKEFSALKTSAIFVIFAGVVNHWVAFIVKKKGAKGLPLFQ